MINICTHKTTGRTLGKPAFWSVLCCTRGSYSLKVSWSKMTDWLLHVIKWYCVSAILFPIRLDIMLFLFEVWWHTDVCRWDTGVWKPLPSQWRILMIFLSFYNDVLHNERTIVWLSVSWRENAGCWFLSVPTSHNIFPNSFSKSFLFLFF